SAAAVFRDHRIPANRRYLPARAGSPPVRRPARTCRGRMKSVRFKLGYGLQARVALLMLFSVAVLVTLIALLLHRQNSIQAEVEGASRSAMYSMTTETLRRRAEGMVGPLAGSLANPLYYYDLDQIGALANDVLRQPGIAYI